MKKITLLFVTMLAMSGMAFGQKEAKVLWEVGPLYISLTGSYKNISLTGSYMKESPSGNVLMVSKLYYFENQYFQYVQYSQSFDINGKPLWNIKDFYNKANADFSVDTNNPNYTLIECDKDSKPDSLLFFDKNFKFIKGFDDIGLTSPKLSMVEDGIFYYDSGKSLIKYDANGKEEWRYKSDSIISIQNKKPPYVGFVIKDVNETVAKQLIILDKNGNKKGLVASELPLLGTTIYNTNDNGFWAKTSDGRFIKYDSTGKKTTTFLNTNLTNRNITKSIKELILKDNSLVLVFFNDKSDFCLTRINSKGEVTNIIKNFGFGNVQENSFEINDLLAKDKTIFYVLSNYNYRSSKYQYLTGTVKFDDLSFGLDKKGLEFMPTYDLDKSGDIFSNIVSISQDSLKIIRYKSDDSILWKLSIKMPDSKLYNIRCTVIKDKICVDLIEKYVVYTNGANTHFYQMDAVTGVLLWKVENEYLYSGDRGVVGYGYSVDDNGNTILVGYGTARGGSLFFNRVRFITKSKDGTFLTTFFTQRQQISGSFDFGFIHFGRDNSFYSNALVYTPTCRDGCGLFRKISPCNQIAPFSIAGVSEACPNETVKLSIPKQEGVSYQWQKDGKDVPSLIDTVSTVGESGAYSVTLKDDICQNVSTSNPVKVTIRTLPITTVQTPKSVFCEGEKTTLTATTNGKFFQWQKDQKDIPNATTGTYETTQTGNYRVGVRDEKCPQIGYSNVQNIVSKQLPEASINTDIKGVVYEPFTVKMTANAGTGLAYQWLKDDAIIPNETKATYEVKKSGKYNLSVTQEGCTKLSDALTISILIPLANSEEIGEEEVKVYPNPSKGEFKIILPKSLKSADIQLFDVLGRERSLIYVGEQAQAEGLIQGVYFLKVSKGEKTVTSKLVIE